LQLIVHKYGGSSLSTTDKLRKVAEKVVQVKRQDYAVLVVVSAMGDETDRLLDLARRIGPVLSPRELDVLLATGETVSTALLSLAIRNLGEEAISLSANQCGVITDEVHNNARIIGLRLLRVKEELERGAIVIVPGFVGMTERQEITTLGRGGSDTTAVALAAAINAKECVIFTDVDGIYSADPRVVPEAEKLEKLDIKVMQELAWHGAQVMKSRAVEYAKAYDMPLVVRSTFKDAPGTLIRAETNASDGCLSGQVIVSGVSGRKDIVGIKLWGKSLAVTQNKNVLAMLSAYDLIFGATGGDGDPSELFISSNEIPDTDAFARELYLQYGSACEVAMDLGAVSIVGFGLGMRTAAMIDSYVLMESIGTPVIKSFTGRESLTFIISRDEVDKCVKQIHRHYVENKPQPQRLLPILR
jgi:aspartate kinase